MSIKDQILDADERELTCSIIGSFRKHYNEVSSLIKILEEYHVSVLSPRRSIIVDPDEWFVRLQTDDPQHDPVEIELIALKQIFRSKFVYVFCPGGYVGKTTCYEIGRIQERGVPLYFSEYPNDLPIVVAPSAIIHPEKFIQHLTYQAYLPPIDDTEISEHVRELQNDLKSGESFEWNLVKR